MKKYRILIIDDDFKFTKEKRQDTIEKFFTNDWIVQNPNICNKEEILKRLPTEFEVEFCATMSEFSNKIEQFDIHAFIIDYVLLDAKKTLEIGDFGKEGFKDVLYKVKEKCNKAPIYVYSAKWDEDSLNDLVKQFDLVFGNKMANQILTFKNFDEAIKELRLNQNPPAWGSIEQVEKTRKQIWNTIAKARKQVSFQPSSPTGDIVILHISDLQFGDKKTTKNDVGMWNNIEDSIRKYLKKNSLNKVDLVVITGDVVMSGKQKEYKEAARELRTFFMRLWGNNDETIKDRILFVPGNHDFDINICVLEYFKAQNKENERVIDFNSVVRQINENKDNKLQAEKGEYQRLGLQAFREFAYEVTQDEQYIRSENLDFIVDKFNNWGIRFICLNSVFGINAQKTNRSDIREESIKEICNTIDCKEEFFTVVLVHHTSLSDEYLMENETSNITKEINSLQRAANVKIVMGGHRHKNDTKNNSNSARKTMHTLEAASLRVEDESDEYMRGFGLVIISGDLSTANLQYFSFDKQDGEIEPEQKYTYEF